MPSHSIFETPNPAKNEIRQLKLLPGKAADPIECALRVVSLDESPRFHALSYVWGDPKDTRGIFVDGQQYDVTGNLEAALCALRRRRGRKILWADAVCINQHDTDEKDTQVPQMWKIYSQASRVLVWLGEPSDATRAAISYLNRYRRARPFLRHMKRRTLPWFDTAAQENELRRMAWGYAKIFAHPYWSRMWTFQEFRIPNAAPLLVRRASVFLVIF